MWMRSPETRSFPSREHSRFQTASPASWPLTFTLDGIVDTVSQMKPLGSGGAMLLSSNYVLSYFKAVANAGDTFKEIFEDLDTTGATVKDMIDRVGKVDGIASSVAAISEEQSASTEEVTVSIDNLAESAAKVADESHGVDTSAETVSGSASTIKDFVNRFKL